MTTARLHLKIGGMACSFCTETIRKAFSRTDGVQAVHVSLAHEEALIEYDPALADPTALKDTLRALGYTVRDPRRVRSFEEQEAELRRERRRLFAAGTLTALALALMVAMWLGLRRPWLRWAMLALSLTTVFGPGWATAATRS